MVEQSILIILKSYTSPADVSETVNKLKAPINSACEKGEYMEADDALWNLWNTLLSYASTLSDVEEQEELVTLLLEIRQPDPPYAEGLVKRWSGESLWPGLLAFGACAREMFDSLAPSDNADGEVQKCVNLNRFLALCTKAKVQDFSVYAFWLVRDTLEEPKGKRSPDYTQRLGEFLPMMEVWMEGLAVLLYGNIGGAVEGWGKEVSRERWMEWMDKLEEICVDGDLEEDTREIAKRIIADMEIAKRSG